ncbi:MAG: SET domain-containing protein [Planctomycetes bacterium]|nr:SET domain-containing protein [Planctomycetota bacterium]
MATQRMHRMKVRSSLRLRSSLRSRSSHASRRLHQASPMDPRRSPLPSLHVMVAARGGHYAVVARRNIVPGTIVMRLDGPLADMASRYTVQVGVDQHVDAEVHPAHGDRYPLWRYLNHSCAPTARVIGRTLRAITALKKGDEVTFDYDATEYDLASPFACQCGKPTCRGMIRGYRHLKSATRATMTWAAPHVLETGAPRRLSAVTRY